KLLDSLEGTSWARLTRFAMIPRCNPCALLHRHLFRMGWLVGGCFFASSLLLAAWIRSAHPKGGLTTLLIIVAGCLAVLANHVALRIAASFLTPPATRPYHDYRTSPALRFVTRHGFGGVHYSANHHAYSSLASFVWSADDEPDPDEESSASI